MNCYRERMKRFFAGVLREFFLPKPGRGFVIRFLTVALVTLFLFTCVLKPFFISGESMLPTYGKNGFTVAFRWSYFFSSPKRGDVVAVSYFGSRYLLKRVLAVANDTVEFRQGQLIVNGKICAEPYVGLQGNWTVPERVVPPGYCFVAGDNRSQDKMLHLFGMVQEKRIIGKVLF